MFDFLKSLFSAKDEEILEKVASIKATEGASINKTNNLTKEIDANKADNANELDGPLFINEQDGKYGFINTKGEQIIECKFDEVYRFSEGLAKVKKDSKWGYINTKGEQVVECKFDSVSYWGFIKGLARVTKDGKYGYINIKGEQVIECKFDNAWDFNEGLARVKDDKLGYINTKGEQVIECKFDGASDFSEGLAQVEKDGKWGYVNTKGEQVIECKFDWVSDFSEGLAKVKKDDKWGYINTKGEQVIECKFDDAWDFSEGLAMVKKGHKRFIINIKGDFVALKEDDSKIEITKEISDKSGNVFLLSKSDDKFGLLDTNHNVLIKNKLYGEFEVVQRMNENTFLIKMAEKEFFIDSNGDFK